MTTATAAAYEYRAGNALPLYALKRRKAQKQRGFRAKSTYGHCIKDEVLIDPFGGSGSTLIACEQLGRICHTIELDEKYCDVIVKRYIEQVGSADTVSVIRDGKTIRFEDLEVSGDGK